MTHALPGARGASDLGYWVRGFLFMNLDYLRQLIAEARAAASKDAERLRMVHTGNLGVNALTTTRGQ